MQNVQTDIKDFTNLHPHRKLAVFGIILFVFVLSILIGVYFSRSQSGQSNNPTSQPQEVADVTTLSLVPSAESLAVGETITVSVMIDGEAVQAVDAAVTFDPTVFTASQIRNGSVYDNLVREVVEEGQVNITAALSSNDLSSLESGELFSFTLEAIAPGTSEISFDPELTITAKNGLNTLQSTQNVVITAE